MHFLLGAAGLLALVTIAFGERSAVILARIIVIAGGLIMVWLAFMIMTGRF